MGEILVIPKENEFGDPRFYSFFKKKGIIIVHEIKKILRFSTSDFLIYDLF